MKRKSIKAFVFGLAFMLGASMLTACSDQGSDNSAGNQENIIAIQGKYVINIKDKKYGLIDLDKKQVIANKYDNLYIESGRLAAKKEGKWGLIDTDEKEIIPFKFDYIYSNPTQDKIYATDYKTTIMYSLDGKEEKTYDYGFVWESSEGTAIVGKDVIVKVDESYANYYNTINIETANYGLIDESGKEILKPEYSNMAVIEEYNKEAKKNKAISIYAEKDGKAGVLSLKGDIIIPMEYEVALVQNELNRYYSISYSGYTQSYVVRKADINNEGQNKYGIFDKSGKQIIETKYNSIKGSKKGYIVTLNEEDAVFDLEGKVLFSDPLVDVTGLSENGFITVTKSKGHVNGAGYCFIDTEGNEVEIESLKGKGSINNLGSFDELGNATIRINTTSGVESALINEKGEFIIGPLKEEVNTMLSISKIDSYNENPSFSSASEYVQKDTGSTDYIVTLREYQGNGLSQTVKTSLYNKEGKNLADFAGDIHDSVTNNFYEISTVEGDTWLSGLMDRSGNIVVEPSYDYTVNYDDYLYACKGDVKYLLDKESGKIVLEY